MRHASDLLYIYAGLGIFISLVIQMINGRSHVDEWKHSSIDIDEDSATRIFRLKKILNKFLSMTLHTCIFMVFWPLFLATSILSYIRR